MRIIFVSLITSVLWLRLRLMGMRACVIRQKGGCTLSSDKKCLRRSAVDLLVHHWVKEMNWEECPLKVARVYRDATYLLVVADKDRALAVCGMFEKKDGRLLPDEGHFPIPFPEGTVEIGKLHNATKNHSYTLMLYCLVWWLAAFREGMVVATIREQVLRLLRWHRLVRVVVTMSRLDIASEKMLRRGVISFPPVVINFHGTAMVRRVYKLIQAPLTRTEPREKMAH